MTHTHTGTSNQRFAWLTPLQGQKSSTGPWVLCENRTQHLENDDTPCVRITVNALLHLLAASFRPEELGRQDCTREYSSHVSECEHFEVRTHKQDNCTSRLFVQKKTDYFQRLELYADQQLVAAYQEPVWPHLQHKHQSANTRLIVPVACVEFLEQLAANQLAASYDITESANQPQIDGSDKNTAAA